MKLKISNKEFWDKVFSRQETPIYVDKADYYDMEKLLSWEKRFDEIKVALNSQDKQKGIEALFELAEEGYPEARRLLSDMYIEGKDLPESFSKAVEWDRRAQYVDRLFVHKRNYRLIKAVKNKKLKYKIKKKQKEMTMTEKNRS